MRILKLIWCAGGIVWILLLFLLFYNLSLLGVGSVLEGKKFAMLLFIGGALFSSLLFGILATVFFIKIKNKKAHQKISKMVIKELVILSSPCILFAIILLLTQISITIFSIALAIVYASISFAFFCSLLYVYLQIKFSKNGIKPLFVILNIIYILLAIFVILSVTILVGMGKG